MKRRIVTIGLAALLMAVCACSNTPPARTKAVTDEDKMQAEELFDIASAYFDEGDLDRAIEGYSAALRLWPDFAEALNYRGFAYAFTGSHDRALADIIEGYRIEEDINIIEEFAYCYLEDEFGTGNDFTRAFNVINAAIRIKPNLPDGYILRGDIYSSMEDYDRAISDYEAALRIYPDDVIAKSHMVMALYIRGIEYRANGDIDRAIADWTAVLKNDPYEYEASALMNRGYAYYDNGDYDRAIADWEAVLKNYPNYPYNADIMRNIEVVRQQRGY